MEDINSMNHVCPCWLCLVNVYWHLIHTDKYNRLKCQASVTFFYCFGFQISYFYLHALAMLILYT